MSVASLVPGQLEDERVARRTERSSRVRAVDSAYVIPQVVGMPWM